MTKGSGDSSQTFTSISILSEDDLNYSYEIEFQSGCGSFSLDVPKVKGYRYVKSVTVSGIVDDDYALYLNEQFIGKTYIAQGDMASLLKPRGFTKSLSLYSDVISVRVDVLNTWGGPCYLKSWTMRLNFEH